MCNICEIRFKNHETLHKHFLMYHIPNTFKCFNCEKSFNKAHFLRIHARETHNQYNNYEEQFKIQDLESHIDLCEPPSY